MYRSLSYLKNHNGIITVYQYSVAAMPSITLKNIPDDLYEKLKESAQLHRRSLNSEVLHCVERTLDTHKIDVEEYLELAKQARKITVDHPLTNEMLEEAKNWGRA